MLYFKILNITKYYEWYIIFSLYESYDKSSYTKRFQVFQYNSSGVELQLLEIHLTRLICHS